MNKTTKEIDAEKAAKSRPDLVPGRFAIAAGRSFGVGAAKHGTPGGLGTYRVAGTEQATVTAHWASLERHLAAIKAGIFMDDEPGGTGLAHIDCACAQLAIIVDLMEDPATLPIPENDRRWYPETRGKMAAEALQAGHPDDWTVGGSNGATIVISKPEPEPEPEPKIGRLSGTAHPHPGAFVDFLRVRSAPVDNEGRSRPDWIGGGVWVDRTDGDQIDFDRGLYLSSDPSREPVELDSAWDPEDMDTDWIFQGDSKPATEPATVTQPATEPAKPASWPGNLESSADYEDRLRRTSGEGCP